VLEPGMRPLPGFRLGRQLGAGGFGEVWEAVNAAGKRVALKFMDCRTKPSSVISAEIRVLRALRELKHPNIIQMFDVYATSHFIVISMERADGNLSDLHQVYLEETGKNVPPDHLLEMLGQVAVGLDFLAGLRLPGFNTSSRGLQHCDIKPSNLLLVGDTVKIADFGLCAASNWQTHKNAWKGTPPYAAPELFKGQATTGTDQYALAVTFLKLCAGDRPFWPTSSTATPPLDCGVDMMKVRESELPILRRALHPLPSCRWPSCQEFVAALRHAILRHRTTKRVPVKAVRDALRARADQESGGAISKT
jgi:serine/threonine protein kinase